MAVGGGARHELRDNGRYRPHGSRTIVQSS